MKNSAGASVDNTLLDLQNSSYPTQPHSIMSKYASDYLQLTVSLGDCYTPEQDLKEKHTSLRNVFGMNSLKVTFRCG